MTSILIAILCTLIFFSGYLLFRMWPILASDSHDAVGPSIKSADKPLFSKKNSFADALKNLLSGRASALEDLLPELEERLLLADVGIQATERLIENLRSQKSFSNQTEIIAALKQEMEKILTPKSAWVVPGLQKPHVIYFVGVNGVGKTTTIGKIAAQLKERGLSVLLVAADTFRAAAADQLKIWAERNAVECITGADGADPSSVIVDGLRAGKARAADVILVDTAGRLQNKSNLMDELRKMSRMCEKVLERGADDFILVVDAVTGQNGFSQAKIFQEAVPLTGVILTKYDSTSKGGIILSIAAETSLPIRYLGMGEKISDLQIFDSKKFVENIFS